MQYINRFFSRFRLSFIAVHYFRKFGLHLILQSNKKLQEFFIATLSRMFQTRFGTLTVCLSSKKMLKFINLSLAWVTFVCLSEDIYFVWRIQSIFRFQQQGIVPMKFSIVGGSKWNEKKLYSFLFQRFYSSFLLE